MATYSKDNFITPGFEISNQIRIRDKQNVLKITITNNTGAVFYNSANNILIKTTSENNIITLDFATRVEAIQALSKLKGAYSQVVKNYNDQKKQPVDPIDIVYNADNGNISDGQTFFPIPSGIEIVTVSINGVLISVYQVDQVNNLLEIDVVELGYIIESDDEVIIKYFS